jgi:hypothetical protein
MDLPGSIHSRAGARILILRIVLDIVNALVHFQNGQDARRADRSRRRKETVRGFGCTTCSLPRRVGRGNFDILRTDGVSDVRKAVERYGRAFGFGEYVKIGERHRAQPGWRARPRR